MFNLITRMIGIRKWILIISLLISISVLNYLLPIISSNMFNDLSNNILIVKVFVSFVLVSCSAYIIESIYNISMHKYSNLINIEVRKRILEKYYIIMEDDLIKGKINNEIYTLYLEDSDKVSQTGFDVFFGIILVVVKIISATAALYFINKDFLVIVLLSSIFVILIQLHYLKIIERDNKILREKYNNYYSSFANCVSNRLYIKLNSIKQLVIEKLGEDNYIIRKKMLSIIKNVSYSQLIINLFTLFITSVLLVYMVYFSKFRFGDYIVLLIYSNKIFSYVVSFPNMFSRISLVKLAAKNIIEFLDYNAEDGINIIDNIHSIKLQGLKYSYDNNKYLEYSDALFKLGNIYLITGLNGSGKSTLLNLLLREITACNKNSIFINSIDINDINIQSYLDCVSYIMQHNNKYDSCILSKSKIEENATLLNLAQEIDVFKFFESDIEVDIQSMSGGERKKVELIYQLIKGKQLLIIDELESDLDEKSIKIIYDYLQKIKRDKIILIVSHYNNATKYSVKEYKI